MPCECLAIIESKSKVCYSHNKPVVAKVSTNTSTFGISHDVAELKDMVKALLLDKKGQNQSPAPVKAVEESCVTCGGAHSSRNCPATDGNVYRDNIQEFISQASTVNYNQGNTSYRPPMMSNQIRPPGFPPVPNNQNAQLNQRNNQNYFISNQNRGNNFNQGPVYQPSVFQPPAYQALAYQAPAPQTQGVSKEDFSACVKANDAVMRNMQTQELADRSISCPVGFAEDVYVKVGSFHFPADFVVVDFDADPRVPLILERSFLKTRRSLIDVFEGELTLRVGKEAITFNLDQTSRYSAIYCDMTAKRIDVIDMACEEYSQEVLGFSDTISSGNPTPYYDLIVSTTSPTLTPFGNSDFLLEEVDAFLATEDDPTPLEFYQPYLDPEGDILLLEEFLNDDPLLPRLNQENYLPEVRKELKICEAKSDKSSVDEPPEVKLKDLPPTSNMHSWKIRRKPHSPAHTERLLIAAYLLGFHDMIEKTMEVFMDDFPVFGNSFQSCLSHLERMLKRCEDTNLYLNWENSHFMVKEGIVLGHKISKQGIEVDKAKVDVTTKLPHPTTVKGIRRKLTEARILIAPDWDMPFELMCDASDYAIGAVLGQHQDKHFRPIHYANWDMPFELMCDASEYAISEVQGQRQDKHFRCVSGQEAVEILKAFHYGPTGGHHGPNYTARKVFDSRLVAKWKCRSLKRILERAVGENRASWSDKLDDALWAFRTAYKTPIGFTPYKLVYEKACHLPVELEHKAYWALKPANFDMKIAGDHRKVQINELNVLHDQAYENSLIYKEKTKRLHDSKIKNRVFNIGDRVLLFNSRLKIFSKKLKSRWSGSFTVSQVYPYGTVELLQPDEPNFKVNGHRVKHYFGEDVSKMVKDIKEKDKIRVKTRQNQTANRKRRKPRWDYDPEKLWCCPGFTVHVGNPSRPDQRISRSIHGRFLGLRKLFQTCLNNLDKMLQHCKDAHLVLNWEKCHFMVKEGIVLGHKVSSAGLKVDKILLLQEFNIEIKDRKGTENVTADNLSRIENDESSDDSEVDDNFPGETLMEINNQDEPWFADFSNYLVATIIPKGMTYQQKNKFFFDLKHYFWEEPYLLKVCSDGMIRRCISGPETQTILDQCYHGPTGGHYGPNVTAKKVLDSGFYWPKIIMEAYTLVQLSEACQKTGNISKRDEMPLNNIQVCEIFNTWGIDFMGPFPKSNNFKYLLVAIDYVSKWVEAQALPTNDARVVVTFLKKLFYRFEMPKALISDGGTHFCNKIMEKNH
nr:reverse transcriptase domain-containing protein [Tanacetum cinerariifolium]